MGLDRTVLVNRDMPLTAAERYRRNHGHFKQIGWWFGHLNIRCLPKPKLGVVWFRYKMPLKDWPEA